MTSEYERKLEQGQRFQDFAMVQLYRHGIVALCYSSRSMQLQGEGVTGIEIKNDTRYAGTGNIYIEVAEKSNARNERYVASGIYRDDNTWLWVIGDESRLFCFSKKQLVKAHQLKQYREVETPTSRGFLLPVTEAEKFWAVKIIEGDK